LDIEDRDNKYHNVSPPTPPWTADAEDNRITFSFKTEKMLSPPTCYVISPDKLSGVGVFAGGDNRWNISFSPPTSNTDYITSDVIENYEKKLY
jgi:hypothetical protein